MFKEIKKINRRPGCFGGYTADSLWTDEHTSKQMLAYHLNEDVEAASRSGEFIGRSVEWIVSRFEVGDGTSIADFGCGPGLYSARLAEKGLLLRGLIFRLIRLSMLKGLRLRRG